MKAITEGWGLENGVKGVGMGTRFLNRCFFIVLPFELCDCTAHFNGI